MAYRLTIANHYQATAAALGDFDDYLSVSATPDETDPGLPSGAARDSLFMPITLVWTDGGVLKTMALICTGWQASPKRLFINPTYGVNTNSIAPAVLCGPDRATMRCLQSAQSLAQTLAGGFNYAAEHGLMHELHVSGPGTIVVGWSFDNYGGFPWQETYGAPQVTGHVTRFYVHDMDGDQPTLTWATDYGSLQWESGAPQFVAGKTRMIVEVVGGNGALFGSYKLFA